MASTMKRFLHYHSFRSNLLSSKHERILKGDGGTLLWKLKKKELFSIWRVIEQVNFVIIPNTHKKRPQSTLPGKQQRNQLFHRSKQVAIIVIFKYYESRPIRQCRGEIASEKFQRHILRASWCVCVIYSGPLVI